MIIFLYLLIYCHAKGWYTDKNEKNANVVRKLSKVNDKNDTDYQKYQACKNSRNERDKPRISGSAPSARYWLVTWSPCPRSMSSSRTRNISGRRLCSSIQLFIIRWLIVQSDPDFIFSTNVVRVRFASYVIFFIYSHWIKINSTSLFE